MKLFKLKEFKMKRIHISNSEINFENKQQNLSPKPTGLWYGINDSWLDWCKSEMPHWISKNPIFYEIHLNNENILFLKSENDIINFSKQYGRPLNNISGNNYLIDWSLVADEYSGIEINPYQYGCRFNLRTFWYYGWDCSSGCIWDKKGINKMIKLEMYVVYQNASDIKEKYCVRKWEITASDSKPLGIFTKGNDYNFIKSVLENSGLINIKRFKEDDPTIKEVWV